MKALFGVLCLLVVFSGVAQEDDEQMLRKLEEEQRARIEKIEKIQKTTETVGNAPVRAFEDMKETGEKLDPMHFLNPKNVAELKARLSESKLHEIPADVLRGIILTNVKGQFAEKVFQQFPKILDITIAIIKDPRAFNGLLDILPRYQDLRFFGYCAIGLFLFGFFLKRYLGNPRARWWKRLFLSLMIQTAITALTLGLFYKMFSNEITPTLQVIVRTL